MPAFRGHDLSVEVGPFVNPIPIKTIDTTEYEGCPGGIIAVYPADTESQAPGHRVQFGRRNSLG